ncbi:glycine betaine ABC transporter substrate-binding protein [Virgibacillus phasianinus]|uniref:glycine betaine ABC transporter substrate-binding protein n=1 Tax=Virgibacillus phasianinus TaxID=2017483 RepID=UPI0026924412
MKKKFYTSTILIAGLMLTLLIAGCGSDEEGESSNTDNKKNYSEAVEHTITGIEPGAGISVTTEKAIEEYDSLKGWSVEESSTAAMMTELDEAIEKQEPIVVTGWNPHWMFAKYEDLKYLKDPKGVYGKTEMIKTLARKGLKEDKPNAYKLLDQFHWEVEDMEGIMLESTESGKIFLKWQKSGLKSTQMLFRSGQKVLMM